MVVNNSLYSWINKISQIANLIHNYQRILLSILSECLIAIASISLFRKLLTINNCLLNDNGIRIYIYIYIYIYIFTNLISISIHGTRKKKPGHEQEKKVSRITAQGKKNWGQKERKGQPRQGIRSQWSKENQKTLRESCNATITKVLNTRQCSQL